MHFLEKLWQMREKKEILDLVSPIIKEILYYKDFYRISISNRNEKTQIITNKAGHSGLSLLELSKMLMHKFWYDYVKPKYGEKEKFSYMDTVSLH